jgi:hypothetical protein
MRFVFFLLLMTSSLMAQNLRLDLNANQVEMEVFMLYIGHVSEHGEITYDLHDLSAQSSFDLPYASSLVFGVDSVTQVLSSYEGVFDPLEGMYWTWQNGYIAVKMEGNYMGEDFVYHLGGFREPFVCYHALEVANHSLLTIDLDAFFESLPHDVSKQIMSPGSEAKTVFDTFVEHVLLD